MTWAIKRCWWLLAVAILAIVPEHSAFARPLDEAKARIHLNAVAAADLDAPLRDYSDEAYLEWVGGPLDGRYRGKAAIRAVWEEFIAATAGTPRPVAIEFSNNDTMRHRGKPGAVLDVEPRDRKPGTETAAGSF
jgi:hypothetical protein